MAMYKVVFTGYFMNKVVESDPYYIHYSDEGSANEWAHDLMNQVSEGNAVEDYTITLEEE